MLALNGRFGPFVQLGELEEGSKAKPPRASLFKSMDPETVDLETALKLLSLPRVVGADAEGTEITAQNGRYGPYLRKGTDSRSLESEDQIFNITLEEAEAIFAQPKQRRGQAKPPLAELGTEPRHREAGAGARRSLRSVRHRRHHERHDPARHRPGGGHARGGGRAAARAGGEGPGEEEGEEEGRQEEAGQEEGRQEEAGEEGGEEDGQDGPAKRVAPSVEPADPQPAAP